MSINGNTSVAAGSGSHVRVGAIQGLRAIAAELELDLPRALLLSGLPLDLLDHAENVLSYQRLVRLLLECERQSGCDHVGLLVGLRTRLIDHGIAGQVALSSETAAAGLARYVRYYNVHTTSAVMTLEPAGRLMRLAYAVCEQGLTDTRQLHYGAMANASNVMQDLCGPEWRAEEITFACRPPADHRLFRRVFRAPLRFNGSVSAVVFERRWLARLLPGANAAIEHAAEQVAVAIEAGIVEDLPGVVRRLVRKKLLTGNCSMEAVAAALSMHRRTLDRHLGRHGVAFEPIVAAVKREVACELLRETSLPLTEIAGSLQYSSAENFATAFRTWTGTTPSAWRNGTLQDADFRLSLRARSRRPRAPGP